MLYKLLKKAKIVPDEGIYPGCEYTLKADDGDPFPPKFTALKVKVLEVKDGWVRYYMNSTFPDERKELKIFARIYERV